MDHTVSAQMEWPLMIISLLNFLLLLLIIGCSIFMFILFVKLARRGIKALDIYIEKNQKDTIK